MSSWRGQKRALNSPELELSMAVRVLEEEIGYTAKATAALISDLCPAVRLGTFMTTLFPVSQICLSFGRGESTILKQE